MTRSRGIEKRIYPDVRLQERGKGGRIGGVLFVIVGLGLAIGNAVLAVREPDLKRLVFGLFGLAAIYSGLLMAGLDLREWLGALINRRTWQRLQVTADGEILDRTVKEHKDSDGDTKYYTYWVSFRFDTAEGPVTLKGLVEKGYYDRLSKGEIGHGALRSGEPPPRAARMGMGRVAKQGSQATLDEEGYDHGWRDREAHLP